MNRLSQSHPSIFNVFAASQEEEEYEEEKTKLNSDQNEYSPIKSEGKRKDRMLSTIDVLISLFVVNPCVVGMWRAIWMYMDLYTAYYPVMSSFALATLLHIISAYKQESVEKFFERRGSSKSVNVFYKVFKRLYIYFFAVVSVTQWRGGWFIFDYLIGLTEILPTWGNSRPALSFAAVCLLCLFSLKACINLMSTPFVIILDRNKQTFTIPTRFKHDFLYTGMMLYKIHNKPNMVMTDVKAEKLTYPGTGGTKDDSTKPPPRAFGIPLRDPPPSYFTVSSTTEKSTTLSYPQLNRYHHQYHPKNIQDILRHLTTIEPRKMNFIGSFKQQEQEQQSRIMPSRTIFKSDANFLNHDPFHTYKPQDPSDVNLLATASFRFAPPAWMDFKRKVPKTTQQQIQQSNQQQYQANSNKLEVVRERGLKPIALTLNVYPMDGQEGMNVGQNIDTLQTVFNYMRGGRSKEKMVIHLNVFPQTSQYAPLEHMRGSNSLRRPP